MQFKKISNYSGYLMQPFCSTENFNTTKDLILWVSTTWMHWNFHYICIFLSYANSFWRTLFFIHAFYGQRNFANVICMVLEKQSLKYDTAKNICICGRILKHVWCKKGWVEWVRKWEKIFACSFLVLFEITGTKREVIPDK